MPARAPPGLLAPGSRTRLVRRPAVPGTLFRTGEPLALHFGMLDDPGARIRREEGGDERSWPASAGRPPRSRTGTDHCSALLDSARDPGMMIG